MKHFCFFPGAIRRVACILLGSLLPGLGLGKVNAHEMASDLVLGPVVGGLFDESWETGSFLEYRHTPILLGFQPWVAAEFFSDSSHFLGMGLLRTFPLGNAWRVTLSFGPGYFRQGSRINLGHELEFRSTAELTYLFPNKHRLGVSLGHLSNGGLSRNNPGSEYFKILYVVPLLR